MSLHRLRQFIAATLFLVLPLQGQAVASMSCHSVQTAALSAQITATVQPAHEHAPATLQATVKEAHAHHAPIQAGAAEPASCALCVACCMLSTALPKYSDSHSAVFKTPQLQAASPVMFAGVVPEGLLRPPR